MMLPSLVLALSAILGVWKGESLCTLKPSPCNDEVVVYYLSAGKKPGTAFLKVDKIVDGEQGLMGTFDCDWDDGRRALDCHFPNGVFKYVVDADGKTMRGTLALPDGRLYRRILVKKVQ